MQVVRTKLRFKLALWYGGLVTVMFIALSLTVLTVSRLAILNTVDSLLERSATEVIQSISVMPVGEFGALSTRVVFRSDSVFNAPGISTQVWQTHNNNMSIDPVLARASNDLDSFNEALAPEQLDAEAVQFESASINGTMARVTTRPFYSAGGQQIGVVQVATSIAPIEQTSNTLLLIVVIGAGISIVIAVLMSMWIAQRTVRPIESITQAAASIATNEDLSTRLNWEGPMDEIGQLSNVFNHMMERLEHLFKVQQRFVGDVSHELRTPLTSILGNLEIMERYGVDADSLDAVHREAARMSRMVNDLLTLARADNGELQVDLMPLELDSIMLDVYEQATILARGRDLRVLLGEIEPAPILGNSDRLKQLLLNLVNNAIKFTEDGGSITLSLTTTEDEARLRVQDTGIGIGPEHLKRIFDRFYQADNSRVHRSEADGAGLGLSIAEWIARAHKGRIEVESTLGVGTTFTLRIPLLPADDGRPIELDREAIYSIGPVPTRSNGR